ncbi:MAG TPA: hypothetical protein VM658_19475 [bacterium]|nr:hypothetical protein [bacterium]
MRKSVFKALPAGVMIALALALTAPARAQQTLGDFYGSKNIQTVTGRYGLMIGPDGGSGGELMFGFNTSSQTTEDSKNLKYFYGVGAGGGGFAISDAGLGAYGTRDTASGYVLLELEFKLFASAESQVRPYLGASLGYGTGYLWTEHLRGEDDPNPSMNLYSAGLEAGIHVPLSNGYGIVAAVGADARYIEFGGASLTAYPAMLTIGVCRWRGPLDE